MNSIRRPRSRPRVQSISFRTFGWLLVREAAWNIQNGAPAPRWGVRSAERYLRRERVSIIRYAESLIERYPEWRYYP